MQKKLCKNSSKASSSRGKDTKNSSALISECEDNIDEEKDAVDNSQGAFSDASALLVFREEPCHLSSRTFSPELKDQDT